MTDLLIKLFIKDGGSVETPAVRSAYGKMAGKVSIFCNLLLCICKFFAGIASGSVSVTADAVNNLSDASSGVISLIGFKLSEKSADAEHPYGHGRYEYLAGFIVAALILVIGVQLLRDSIVRIVSPEEVEFGILPLGVLAVSIIVKLWMMLFNRRIGRLISSETLFAAAADSRNDVISTSAVLAALIISRCCSVELDGIMGAAVAVFILYSGVGLIKDALDPLLGKAPSPELVEKIHEKILSYNGILGTHDLMIHDYGPGRQFASVHVEVPAEMTLVECHEIIDGIERDFLREGMNMLVHPDPIVSEGAAGELNAELNGIVGRIDGRISVHDIRVVRCPEGEKVIFDCVLPPDSGIEEKALAEEITRFLRVNHPSCRCVITFDSGYASIPKSSDKDA
ncbi:MAG: cation diffusion facilitator family transporter [Lachnospiraceae bacterium]|nr:cation diffusion facilitator family transporter [Ruminococcus sp.]MCM1274820.1 cation diffusion facilitator family transporter [Lachnospiraceae bacterium]